jgi:hypothetical protein
LGQLFTRYLKPVIIYISYIYKNFTKKGGEAVKKRKKEFDKEIGGFRCVHCGTPNPDRGPVCGNCDENPFTGGDEEWESLLESLPLHQAR